MNPQLEQRLNAIESQINELNLKLSQFQNVAQLDPQIQRTILAVVGALNITLDSLSDVIITTPSTGQVLKYNGSAWVNDIDNI